MNYKIAYKTIEEYISKNGYTQTVSSILGDYKRYYVKNYYVSYTTNLIMGNCKKEIKYLTTHELGLEAMEEFNKMNYSKLYYEITLSQLLKMKHTIGYDREKVKYNIYKAWRNYFTTYEEDEELEKLVEWGLMNKSDKRDSWQKCIVYFVNKEGFKFMANVEGIRVIKESD